MSGDKITEIAELLESFPPGTFVRAGQELHRIDSIVFDGAHMHAQTSMARAEYIDAYRYRYEYGKGVMFLPDLISATKITNEDFTQTEGEILSRVSDGMERMIERMCLLSGSGDKVPADRLSDHLLDGGRFFMYQPDADTLRFFGSPKNYTGDELDVHHLVVRIGCLVADVLRLNPEQIAEDVHPITEYQFIELKKLIEYTNGINQEEPVVLRRAEQQ